MVNVNDNCVFSCLLFFYPKIHILDFPIWLSSFSSQSLCLPMSSSLSASSPRCHPCFKPTIPPDQLAYTGTRHFCSELKRERCHEEISCKCPGGIASALVIRRHEVLQTVNSNGRPKFKNYSTTVVP